MTPPNQASKMFGPAGDPIGLSASGSMCVYGPQPDGDGVVFDRAARIDAAPDVWVAGVGALCDDLGLHPRYAMLALEPGRPTGPGPLSSVSRMLHVIEREQLSWLAIRSTDRLGRSALAVEDAAARLEALGVRLYIAELGGAVSYREVREHTFRAEIDRLQRAQVTKRMREGRRARR